MFCVDANSSELTYGSKKESAENSKNILSNLTEQQKRRALRTRRILALKNMVDIPVINDDNAYFFPLCKNCIRFVSREKIIRDIQSPRLHSRLQMIFL